MSPLGLRSRLRARLLRPRLRLIKLVVCDVDGVLTDGGLHYDDNGLVIKRFDVRDGLAVRLLQEAGITVALLSGGRGGAIEQRAHHLGIQHCYTGIDDKLAALQQLRQKLAMERVHTAFLGDDLNDLALKPATGLLVTPADGAQAMRRKADWVLRRRGGHGALRELCEAVLASRGALAALHQHGWRHRNG